MLQHPYDRAGFNRFMLVSWVSINSHTELSTPYVEVLTARIRATSLNILIGKEVLTRIVEHAIETADIARYTLFCPILCPIHPEP